MPETKTCRKCGETKPLYDFSPDPQYRGGHKNYCRPCMNSYLAEARRNPNHPAFKSQERHEILRNDPTSERYWSGRECSWRHAGITLLDGSPFLRDDYQRLSDLQGGVCALCGRHPPMWSPTLAVDHDAKTGFVRGLLCSECNHRAVGTFERHGHFTRRKEVNDLIRSYLENPPASRLPACAEAEPEPLPDTPVYSAITSPPKSAISWISAWTYTSTPAKETP